MKRLETYIIEAKSKCTCYMLIGLPGAGKSTWCKTEHPELQVVSRDIIRAELGYTKDADEKAVLDFKKEQEVTDKEHEMMQKLAEEGTDFIMDDTNLKRKYRKKTVEWLRSIGAKVVAVYFDTPLETCIKRREGQIDAETMKKIASGLAMPERDEYDELIKVK